MVQFLFDTDTCIDILRDNAGSAAGRLALLNRGDVAMSVVTWGELMRGAHLSRETEQALRGLDRFERTVPVMPMPTAAGSAYGRTRVLLERRGQIIDNNDLWIAAHALAENLTLVSNNEREFSRVPGLALENWVRG